MKMPVLLLLLALTVPGCAPHVSYKIDTVIRPDLGCERQVALTARPDPKVPTQQVKIKDYLEFAEAEKYENFVLLADRAALSGRFASVADVPADFRKLTLQTDAEAKNRLSCRAIDLVLLQVIDFEEVYEDIVDRAGGEIALDKLVTLGLDTLLFGLHEKYDAQYDLAPLEKFLRGRLPTLTRRLYATLWEIRRSRRDGMGVMGETEEWIGRLQIELARALGEAPAAGTPVSELKGAWFALLARKVQELCPPRAAGTAPLSVEFLQSSKERSAWLLGMQQSVTRQHGSLDALLKKAEPLLPEAFGAFLVSHFSLLPVNPEFDFQLRLRLPGEVIHTNGLRDLDGRVLWTFRSADLALSGTRCWARSILVRSEAVAALGLQDFPGRVGVVERLYQQMRTPSGSIREPLIAALRAAVEAKSWAPLEEVAKAATEDGRAAARLLTTLRAHTAAGQKEKAEAAQAEKAEAAKAENPAEAKPEAAPPAAAPETPEAKPSPAPEEAP